MPNFPGLQYAKFSDSSSCDLLETCLLNMFEQEVGQSTWWYSYLNNLKLANVQARRWHCGSYLNKRQSQARRWRRIHEFLQVLIKVFKDEVELFLTVYNIQQSTGKRRAQQTSEKCLDKRTATADTAVPPGVDVRCLASASLSSMCASACCRICFWSSSICCWCCFC